LSTPSGWWSRIDGRVTAVDIMLAPEAIQQLDIELEKI
jgi:hypothetical protein